MNESLRKQHPFAWRCSALILSWHFSLAGFFFSFSYSAGLVSSAQQGRIDSYTETLVWFYYSLLFSASKSCFSSPWKQAGELEDKPRHLVTLAESCENSLLPPCWAGSENFPCLGLKAVSGKHLGGQGWLVLGFGQCFLAG